MNLNEFVMKKAFITFVALFLVNLCISAQIQRKFFDFTLGQTTKNEVESYFKSKGKETLEYTADRIVVDGMRFGGNDWLITAFIFYKGKLQMVYFADDERSSSKHAIRSVWDRMVNSIDKKYSEYLKALLSNEKHLFYSDSKTSISLTFDDSDGKDGITLLYSDEVLVNNQIKDGEEEL